MLPTHLMVYNQDFFRQEKYERPDKAFKIAMEGLTSEQCRRLVTQTMDMFPYIVVEETVDVTIISSEDYRYCYCCTSS